MNVAKDDAYVSCGHVRIHPPVLLMTLAILFFKTSFILRPQIRLARDLRE